MRGDLSTGRKRHSHPYDWYVDECWVAMQLYRALGGFAAEKAAGEAIWDPSAGLGNTIEHFQHNGHVTFASDIVERIDYSLFSATAAPLPQFFSADFLETTAAPARCSIVFNPPYSYIKGISEAFVRHALMPACAPASAASWSISIRSAWTSALSKLRLRRSMIRRPILHRSSAKFRSMTPGFTMVRSKPLRLPMGSIRRA